MIMLKQWKIKSVFTICVLLFCSIPLFSLTNKEAEDLVKFVDMKLYPKQCKYMVHIKNYKGEGRETQNKIEYWRKDDKFLVIFLTPPIQKGQKILRNGDEMWMYLQKSKRVMRISAKEKSMGGEANNSDVMRVDLVKDYTVQYLGDEKMDNTVCHKLELKGKNRKVAYNKIIYWISKKQKLPVKRELYSISGKLMKNMYFEDVKNIGGMILPSKWIIENAINKTYRSEGVILKVNKKARLRDNMFTTAYLKRM